MATISATQLELCKPLLGELEMQSAPLSEIVQEVIEKACWICLENVGTETEDPQFSHDKQKLHTVHVVCLKGLVGTNPKPVCGICRAPIPEAVELAGSSAEQRELLQSYRQLAREEGAVVNGADPFAPQQEIAADEIYEERVIHVGEGLDGYDSDPEVERRNCNNRILIGLVATVIGVVAGTTLKYYGII